ncbi:MAG: HAMP domain-containing sensor histidine kinase [Alphaproteobacteria bacterium]|nr:HAMP domain-containing sensor histidine kinase [Alphaproteobacteria bacterium]
MLRRRLYLQIYFTIIASLVIVVVLSGLLWSGFGRDHLNREVFDITGRLAYLALPAADSPDVVQRQAVERLGRELGIDISLFNADWRLIASSGEASPPSPRLTPNSRWHSVHGGRAWALDLPDGRWLVADLGRRGVGRPLLKLALFLGSVALGVGLGAYPFVRRLTRRLERLQKGVERIGSGDLAARIEVEGRDEVASLAASFNEAAEKIEKLFVAHRLLLANASHELRTPLSRIRFGVELLKNGGDPARRTALQHDIAELDSLIDEILLMSRLDAGSHADLSQKVDLVALVAEECARYEDCTLSGWAPELPGDPRLLHRLVRNLLENAYNHGVPPVEAEIVVSADAVALTVSDGGDGISEADREKVFQPFYRASGKQNVQGYGLGLPLVRQIAEAHGGSVAILPREEARSSIRVTLPVGEAE